MAKAPAIFCLPTLTFCLCEGPEKPALQPHMQMWSACISLALQWVLAPRMSESPGVCSNLGQVPLPAHGGKGRSHQRAPTCRQEPSGTPMGMG